ncbi:MAG: hypothetical protein KGH96_23095 [Sphingomonadales bacterium]|nr:hypothetical protein [Sphingomonadales bacterium]
MEAVRMSLAEAGRLLGIPTNTVRSRWKAGKMRGERDNSGRVFVWVDPTSEQKPLKPSSQVTNEGEVGALREHIDTLQAELTQVRAERDALAIRASEADRLQAEATGLAAAVADARTDRDYWREKAQQAFEERIRSLEEQVQNAEQPRRSWWPFGRR